jgi:phosphate-selective porin OprO and OprP
MHLRFAVLLTFLMSAAGPVAAQQGAVEVPPEEVPGVAPPVRVVAGQDGIAIESGNGEYRLQIGLLLQADGRFAAQDDTAAFTDTFAFRRLRPYLRGRILRRFEFHLNPDFAGGTLVVQDAYFDTIFSPAFRIRAGKGKHPFGMERLHSASNLLFMDRALPTALAPNRDLGVQVLGDVHGGVFSYLAGVMNGVADGGSADLDSNDGKDLSARVIVRPFTRNIASPLRGFGVAVSGNTGRQSGAAALPSFRTQTLQQPYFSYATGAVASGRRIRYSPQLFFFRGPFGGWAEYVHTEMPVTRAGVTEDIEHKAWQVAASWVLTGEAATDAGVGVRPRAIFDPATGHWGAFQVVARVHQLEVDQRAVDLGFAAAGSSRKAQAWTVGLNWYLSANVKYVLNVERTVFDDNRAGAHAPENGIAFRTQLNF